MKRNIFCNRKNGATINGKFHKHQTVTEILAAQTERKNNKMEARYKK